MGKPYSLPAFNGNYERALVRIGSSAAKPEGRSPHGHRHAFGRRLAVAGVNPVIIRKAMHHLSMESQKRYTTPGISHMSLSLDAATERLNQMAETGEVINPLPYWESTFNESEDD
jgi:integrase